MFPHHTEFRSALLMLMLDAKHQSDTCMTRELARASFFFCQRPISMYCKRTWLGVR